MENFIQLFTDIINAACKRQENTLLNKYIDFRCDCGYSTKMIKE